MKFRHANEAGPPRHWKPQLLEDALPSPAVRHLGASSDLEQGAPVHLPTQITMPNAPHVERRQPELGLRLNMPTAPVIDLQDIVDGPEASSSEILDCVVVGGGPAGLTAGLYLRRFHRNVRVVDAGAGRMRRIFRSHNVAGFPEGVTGGQLLDRMRRHLQQVDGHVIHDTVWQIERRSDGLFALGLTHELLWARNILLCTGVEDRPPNLPGIPAVESADLLRYCAVCDGYEFTGKRIGVIGNSSHAVKEATFLRHFSADIWFIEVAGRVDDLDDALRLADLHRVPGIARHLAVDHERQAFVTMDDGEAHRFDVLYAGLGADPCTQLAVSLGARLDDSGNVVTDSHGRTSVDHVYAAGDVVSALDQISVAVAHAAIAATTIHNSL